MTVDIHIQIKKITVIVLMAIAVACIAYQWKPLSKTIGQVIQKTKGSEPTFDNKAFKKAFTDAEKLWAKAEGYIDTDNFYASLNTLETLYSGPYQYYLSYFPEAQLEAGVTASSFHESRMAQYKKEVAAVMPRLLFKLENGTYPWQTFKDIMTRFNHLSIPEVSQAFEDSKDRIQKKREDSAQNWVRVLITGDNGPYQQTLLQALNNAWSTRYNKELVFSEPMTNKEQENTWKTLTIHVKEADLVYTNSTNKETSAGSQPRLTLQMSLSFAMEGSPKIPTTWDALSPITCLNDIPDYITSTYLSKSLGKAKNLEEIYYGYMKKTILKSLSSLPLFQVYPGADTDSVTLVKNGALDMDAVDFLSLADPIKLENMIHILIRQNDDHLRAELILLIIQKNFSAFSNWVTDHIDEISGKDREKVLNELAEKPWFGGYKPLINLIINTENHIPDRVYAALIGHLSEPFLQLAVISKVKDPAFPGRTRLATFFIAEAPKDVIRSQVAQWLSDPDINFANQIYASLLNRQPAVIDELFMERFTSFPERVRILLLRFMRYSPERHGKKGLDILVETALGSSSKALRDKATDILAKAINNPDVWTAYKEIADATAEYRKKRSMHDLLISNAHSAHPKDADAYFLSLIHGKDKELRSKALDAMLSGNSQKSSILKELYTIYSAENGDASLLKEILNAFSRHYEKENGWGIDENNSPFWLFVDEGNKHTDRDIKITARTIIEKAAQNGSKAAKKRL